MMKAVGEQKLTDENIKDMVVVSPDAGGLKMAYNPGYSLPADVKAAADKAIADIKSGAITVQP